MSVLVAAAPTADVVTLTLYFICDRCQEQARISRKGGAACDRHGGIEELREATFSTLVKA
jgi:hypothetical protein